MSHKIYIGIDNGVTGTIGWVYGNQFLGKSAGMVKTPIKSEQSYTKAKKNISRIAYPYFRELIAELAAPFQPNEILVIVERPMINSLRFQASISAARSLEATLIAIEDLDFPRMYVDSRQWQKVFLPKECKGKELKKASKDIGCRLFPGASEIIIKHGDSDALLIAEWARREGL